MLGDGDEGGFDVVGDVGEEVRFGGGGEGREDGWVGWVGNWGEEDAPVGWREWWVGWARAGHFGRCCCAGGDGFDGGEGV